MHLRRRTISATAPTPTRAKTAELHEGEPGRPEPGNTCRVAFDAGVRRRRPLIELARSRELAVPFGVPKLLGCIQPEPRIARSFVTAMIRRCRIAYQARIAGPSPWYHHGIAEHALEVGSRGGARHGATVRIQAVAFPFHAAVAELRRRRGASAGTIASVAGARPLQARREMDMCPISTTPLTGSLRINAACNRVASPSQTVTAMCSGSARTWRARRRRHAKAPRGPARARWAGRSSRARRAPRRRRRGARRRDAGRRRAAPTRQKRPSIGVRGGSARGDQSGMASTDRLAEAVAARRLAHGPVTPARGPPAPPRRAAMLWCEGGHGLLADRRCARGSAVDRHGVERGPHGQPWVRQRSA